MNGADICTLLKGMRFTGLHNEKELQAKMAGVFHYIGGYHREYRLDDRNILDFFLDEQGVAIELKIKGSRLAIFKQCERYCAFPEVRSLVLITNRAMGLPPTINGKPVYLFNLSKAWL